MKSFKSMIERRRVPADVVREQARLQILSDAHSHATYAAQEAVRTATGFYTPSEAKYAGNGRTARTDAADAVGETVYAIEFARYLAAPPAPTPRSVAQW